MNLGDDPSKQSLFATCAPGLEDLLQEEIQALFATRRPHHKVITKVTPGGVEFTGSLQDIYLANLHLGLALDVRVRLATFHASGFDTFVKRAARVDVSPWLRQGVAVRFRVRAKKSRLHHTKAIAERLHQALSISLGCDLTAIPRAPNAREQDPLCTPTTTTFYVRLVRDRCTLSVDTSGPLLHRRGYRRIPSKAPLREDLARALLKTSRFINQPRHPTLVDPFCGSGTLLIEAALLHQQRAPGAMRRFAFMNAPNFDRIGFEQLVSEAHTHTTANIHTQLQFQGSDRDAGAIKAANANAARAGLSESIPFTQASFSETLQRFQSLQSQPIFIVTNPPYGQRIGRRKPLQRLYHTLGHAFSEQPDWSLAIVSPDANLSRTMKLPLQSRVLTDHGGTKVRFYTFRGAAPLPDAQ